MARASPEGDREKEEDDKARIRRLEFHVAELEARLRRVERHGGPPPERVDMVDFAASRPRDAPRGPPEPTTPVAEAVPRPVADIEDRLGGDLLAKAGMVTLVLGVAFFLRYAFEHDWIGLSARIALGVVGGLALAAVGDVLHQRRRYGVYPQVLAGGGAVIMYFAIYAAYAFPEYRAATGMGELTDAVLLGVVAASLGGYAVWRSTPSLAALAAFLGALTALVGGRFDAFSVYYLVLLSAGLTAAAVHRRWPHVALVVMGASHVTLGIDLARDVDPGTVMVGSVLLLGLFAAAGLRASREEAGSFAVGLTVFGAAFAAWGAIDGAYDGFVALYPVLFAVAVVAVAVLRTPSLSAAVFVAAFGAFAVLAVDLAVGIPPDVVMAAAAFLLAPLAVAAFRLEDEGKVRDGVPAASALTGGSLLAAWGILLWGLTLEDATSWRGPVTAFLGALGIAFTFVDLAPKESRIGWGFAGIVLALAWPPIQFDGVATAVAWTALLYVGALAAGNLHVPMLRVPLLAAAGLTAAHLVVMEAPDIDDGTLSRGVGLLVFAAATAAFLLAWRVLWRVLRSDAPEARVQLALGLGAPVVYLAVALDRTAISIAWAAEAMAVVATGFALGIRDLRLAAFGLFGIVLARVFLVDLAVLDVAYRIITFIVVGGLLLGASFLYARAKRASPREG